MHIEQPLFKDMQVGTIAGVELPFSQWHYHAEARHVLVLPHWCNPGFPFLKIKKEEDRMGAKLGEKGSKIGGEISQIVEAMAYHLAMVLRSNAVIRL